MPPGRALERMRRSQERRRRRGRKKWSASYYFAVEGGTYGVVRATQVCTWNSVSMSDSPFFTRALVLSAMGCSLIAIVTGAMIRFSDPTLLRNWPTGGYP